MNFDPHQSDLLLLLSRKHKMNSFNNKELENLKMQLYYNENTGIFYWKNVKPRSKYKIGDVAGCTNKNNGYVQIRLNQKTYLAHRIAFAFINGYFPQEVDHKNHNRADNRISNLRDSTRATNSRNLKNYRRDREFAVSIQKNGKFRVRPKFDGLNYHLGIFNNIEDAIKIRNKFYQEKGFKNEHSNH